MANARIYLKSTRAEAGGGFGRSNTVAQVVTDASGRWQAAVHPQDATSLSALIGVPAGPDVKHTPGQPLDAAGALAGKAVVTLSHRE
jgi:hypothetical protein